MKPATIGYISTPRGEFPLAMVEPDGEADELRERIASLERVIAQQAVMIERLEELIADLRNG